MAHKRALCFSMMALTLGINAGFAQTGTKTSPEQLLRDGIAFYSEGKFSETIGVLRRVPSGAGHYPEALYWISLAEISSGDYEQALLDLDALAKADPRGRWVEEIPYHRGRSLFYLARYEEAFLILKNYTDRPDEKALSRKDSAYYWMGECLLALGQLDSAANAFSVVVEKYPSSAKYEASSYRLELINQKKIEAELLSILKWTHEESLKTLEEYQTREKTYDQAIAAYQRRLSGTEENGLTEPERVGLYRDRLEAAEQRIAGLEASLAEANAALIELRGSGVRSSGSGSPSSSLDDTERTLKLLEIKAAALELSNALNNRLRTLGGER